MPARIVIAEADVDLLSDVVRGLQQRGLDVVGFSDSREAYELLRTAQKVEVLVTGINFRAGTPHGVALASAAKIRRPDMKTIFVARRDLAKLIEGEGRVLLRPVSWEQVCAAVQEALGT